jgi:putative ABC transport system ATP-binding protein
MAKITLTNVSKEYKVKRKLITALDNINLTIDDTAFLVLTGPSGSGKSTILQLISGIEQPTSGQVIINDQDITKLSAQELAVFRRQNVGIIFQQFYLEPTLSLRYNIELPAIFLGLSAEKRATRTAELAKTMGLTEHLDHLPSELSGGQIQRAAVARAIYNKPSILIADEPTSNLDYDNFLIIIEMLKQIQKIYRTTIIIATHDRDIAKVATQNVKLENGSIIA